MEKQSNKEVSSSYNKSKKTVINEEAKKPNTKKEQEEISKFKKLLYKLDILEEDHHHHEEGESHADVKLWKLIIGLMVLPLALVQIPMYFDDTLSYLPDVMLDPWWMFGWSTFIFIFIGSDFVVPAFNDIKNKNISVTLFVNISAITAWIYSTVIICTNYDGLVNPEEEVIVFFDSVIEILVIIYLGNYLEGMFTSKATKGVESIMELFAKDAIIIKNKKEITVKPKDLKVGDIVIVKNGEKIPVDGLVTEGQASIDEATFTGESIPITKTIGSTIIGGTIVDGHLIMKVTKTLEDSLLTQVVHGIEKTRDQKTKTTKIANRFGAMLLPLIFIASVTALITWSIVESPQQGIQIFITSLIVTCPMSLIFLTPTATLVSTSVAAKKGIVYNSEDIFERTKKLDAIIFDKTGTLTHGKLSIVDHTIKDKKILSIVKTIEKSSNHPISKAITKKFEDLEEQKLTSVKEILGFGIVGKINNKEYYIGSFEYLQTQFKTEQESESILDQKQHGSIFIYVWDSKKIYGYIKLEDKIKEDAEKIIEKFKDLKVDVYMITGDNALTANYVAQQVGIESKNVYTNISPLKKAEIINDLQNDEDKYICFVGDGINDAVALEQADIGISVADGSSVANDSADITLQNHELKTILEALRISRTTLLTIYIGIVIAISYNLVVLGLAVSGVFGILGPIFASFSMIINDTMPVVISSTLYRLKKDKY